jgi:hypothetical protein
VDAPAPEGINEVAMNDLEGLSIELNRMRVGQAYAISERALSEIGWNWMEYG